MLKFWWAYLRLEYLLFKKMEINSNPNESKAMNDGDRTYCEFSFPMVKFSK